MRAPELPSTHIQKPMGDAMGAGIWDHPGPSCLVRHTASEPNSSIKHYREKIRIYITIWGRTLMGQLEKKCPATAKTPALSPGQRKSPLGSSIYYLLQYKTDSNVGPSPWCQAFQRNSGPKNRASARYPSWR